MWEYRKIAIALCWYVTNYYLTELMRILTKYCIWMISNCFKFHPNWSVSIKALLVVGYGSHSLTKSEKKNSKTSWIKFLCAFIAFKKIFTLSVWSYSLSSLAIIICIQGKKSCFETSFTRKAIKAKVQYFKILLILLQLKKSKCAAISKHAICF